jgi:hypothetical protein
MDGKEISLFVRDEQNGRFLFNAKALQALGINPVEAQQRGYPLKEVAEAREELRAGQRPQCMGGYRSHARSTAKRLRSASEQ